MALKINYLIVCDQVILANDGTSSIINIFTTINFKKLPAIIPRLVILVNTKGENGKYKEKVQLVSPDGHVVAETVGEVNIIQEDGNNLIANFIPMVFEKPGKYEIKVLENDTQLHEDGEYIIKVQETP